MLFGGIIAWITVSPFLLIGTYHYTPIEFGFAQIPIFGSYILGTFVLKLALKFEATETGIIKNGIAIAAITSASMYLLFKFGAESVCTTHCNDQCLRLCVRPYFRTC